MAPTFRYHASPPSNRESIRHDGLRPGTSASYGPPGVYLFKSDLFAENYVSEPMDVWRVDVSGLDLYPDPEDPAAADYSLVPIAPERLEWTGTFVDGEPIALAENPHLEEHSFRYVGNCTHMTGSFVRFTTRCVWEVGQPDCEITYRTFARWAERGTARWFRDEVCNGCGALSTDPYIAFYKSTTPSGIPTVFFKWSGIEFFFIPDDAEFDLAHETELAEALDY